MRFEKAQAIVELDVEGIFSIEIAKVGDVEHFGGD